MCSGNRDARGAIVHPTAEVSPNARVGPGTQIWHQAQVREDAQIGQNCVVGKGVYIDFGVTIGDNVKLQNGCSVYHGATVEDGAFIGPGVVLTNDRRPRAVNPDGTLKLAGDWTVSATLVKRGASVGAGAIVLAGVTVGAYAMIGAGAVVTRDVPDYCLAYGNPARIRGFVCVCGRRLQGVRADSGGQQGTAHVMCPDCKTEIALPLLGSSLGDE